MPANPATIRKSTLLVSALSILPHLFCCGVPVVVALISLGSTIGLTAALAANPAYRFVDQYHEVLLALAVASVILSGILNAVAWRMDCRAAARSACRHEDCAPKKSGSFKIFFLSCALLALDIAWYATERFALNLHEGDAAPHARPAHR